MDIFVVFEISNNSNTTQAIHKVINNIFIMFMCIVFISVNMFKSKMCKNVRFEIDYTTTDTFR